jgi:hypothetical protein
VIALILIVASLGLFLTGLAGGRYGSWFGIVVPVAITVALGIGWQWDPDAIPFVIAAAVLGGLGFAAGMHRRRKRRAAYG